MSFSLERLGVLVTRPAHQAEPLCRLIAQHGGIPIRFPTVQIAQPQNLASALAILSRLDAYHLAIFTSPNAVERAFPHIRAHGGIPPALEIAAIGKATAQKLTRFGVSCCWQPESDYTSEGLLRLGRFQQVAGQAIIIVRGENGRALLADTLLMRGARVDFAEVYRRQRPATEIGLLLERWKFGEIGAVVVTSTEILLNLFDMLSGPEQDYLRNTPLITLSARTQQTAAEYGCRRILVAENASDEAIVSTLLDLAVNPLLQLSSVMYYDRQNS